MLPRFVPLPLALAVLAGCTTSNNYDSTANPFDEPLRAVTVPSSAPIMALPEHNEHLPLGRPTVVEPRQSEDAQSFAVSDAPLQVAAGAAIEPVESPHAQEMTEEANRIGALGDVQGKAELLAQAGYSGSPKAFYDLARMYLDGTLPSDMSQAVSYITMAHDAGYSEATRVLGMLYIRGQGVVVDEGYGRKLMEQASKSSPRAAREYGQLLTNQSQPHLNDPELGIHYLQDAANRGDQDAARMLSSALSKAGRPDEAAEVAAQAKALPSSAHPTEADGGVKSRALSGDTSAMFTYAQQVMLRKIPDSSPEFTAYCWLSVAKQFGNHEAANELGLISGVRSLSDKKNPGLLDQCINDLHYQISGS